MNDTNSWKPVLDSRQLLTFAALARRRSFTLAARDISLTQSAVSHAIKALEREMGCQLVDRTGKRVLLTQAGELFLGHAEKILREMEIARSALEKPAQRRRLRIGAGVTACQYILPEVLQEFRKAAPECALKLEPASFTQQLDLLRGNHIDFALTLEPVGESDLDFAPLFHDELQFFVAPHHRWAETPATVRENMSGQTVLLASKSGRSFQMLNDYFREEKVLLSNFIELGSVDAIKALAKTGFGPGILPSWVAKTETESGTLRPVPLGARKLKRRWGISYLKGRKLALGGETFVQACEKAIKLLMPSAMAALVSGFFSGMGEAIEITSAVMIG